MKMPPTKAQMSLGLPGERLTLAEAAMRLGVSAKTVRRRVQEGKLTVYRNGNRFVFEPRDVAALDLARSRQAASVPGFAAGQAAERRRRELIEVLRPLVREIVREEQRKGV